MFVLSRLMYYWYATTEGEHLVVTDYSQQTLPHPMVGEEVGKTTTGEILVRIFIASLLIPVSGLCLLLELLSAAETRMPEGRGGGGRRRVVEGVRGQQ